jgi:hypothetical protein
VWTTLHLQREEEAAEGRITEAVEEPA